MFNFVGTKWMSEELIKSRIRIDARFKAHIRRISRLFGIFHGGKAGLISSNMGLSLVAKHGDMRRA
jgi:hypothetical protein